MGQTGTELHRLGGLPRAVSSVKQKGWFADAHPMTIAMVAIPVSTLLDGDNPPIPDDDNEGGHTQRSLAQRIVGDGGTITLHFVFLVLNNDFVIFYS